MVKKKLRRLQKLFMRICLTVYLFSLKKRDIYFDGFDIRCFYIFKLIISPTSCYRVIILPLFQVQGIISAIHTARINLSPFTKDFRVWVALQEITIICLQAVPSGTATHLNLNIRQITVVVEPKKLTTLYINNPDTTQLWNELIKQKV